MPFLTTVSSNWNCHLDGPTRCHLQWPSAWLPGVLSSVVEHVLELSRWWNCAFCVDVRVKMPLLTTILGWLGGKLPILTTDPSSNVRISMTTKCSNVFPVDPMSKVIHCWPLVCIRVKFIVDHQMSVGMWKIHLLWPLDVSDNVKLASLSL